MIKTVIAGAAGRMGQRLVFAVHQNPEFKITGVFERPDHPAVGQDPGLLAGLGQTGLKIKPSLKEVLAGAEVLIDFTAPQATLEHIRLAAGCNLALVIGTTGMSGRLLEEVTGLANGLRCVMTPNMSVGMNVMFHIASSMAKALGRDFDMEILETHHRLKKDAPSGTAMRLARILADAQGRDLEKVAVYERKGLVGERTQDEIGIQTWRGGDIIGEHTVLFAGIGERLELIHRAQSRDNFARGAVKAAAWVVRQPPGLYDMQDVLGLKK